MKESACRQEHFAAFSIHGTHPFVLLSPTMMASNFSGSIPPPPPPPPPPLPPPLPPPPTSITTQRQHVTVTAAPSTTNTLVVSPDDTSDNNSSVVVASASVRDALTSACQILEQARCLESELEANMIFASSLLGYTPGTSDPIDISSLPGALQDAWHVMSNVTAPPLTATTNNRNATTTKATTTPKPDVFDPLIPAPVVLMNDLILSTKQGDDKVLLGRGKLGDMAHITALSTCLKRAATGAAEIQKRRKESDGPALVQALTTAKTATTTTTDSNDQHDDGSHSYHRVWLTLLEERLRQVREYHARHAVPTTYSSSGVPPAILGSTSTNATATTTVSTTMPMTATGAGPKRKRMKLGNVAADGYDLSSTLLQTLTPLVEEEGYFTTEEVMGKYLDFRNVYHSHVVPLSKHVFQKATTTSKTVTSTSSSSSAVASTFTLSDFVSLLLHTGLAEGIPEEMKLRERKKYAKFLTALLDYVQSYLQRTTPLLQVTSQIIEPALQEFATTWRETGGYQPGWQAKPMEKLWVDLIIPPDGGGATNDVNEPTNTTTTSSSSPTDNNNKNNASDTTNTGLYLSRFASAQELAEAVDGDTLKMELARLGLKCGGTVADRAQRLFLTKDTPLDQLPAKLFVKGLKKPIVTVTSKTKESEATIASGNDTATTTSTPTTITNITTTPALERRVDLARLEVMVTALLDQLRPSLEATLRRLQRQQAQTLKEREQEVYEELHGAPLKPRDENQKSKKDKSGDDDDEEEDDEDDAPIYNPKGVPLGWDGKPIPYWLYKLHGLNHFYECEICGNESYRGRMNFEKHFTEAKHAYGMKCLGIPNTKHFHGVTKIEDAQQLWKTLSEKLNVGQFDATREEEYEDSHGNVMSRATYEDLARQGLL